MIMWLVECCYSQVASFYPGACDRLLKLNELWHQNNEQMTTYSYLPPLIAQGFGIQAAQLKNNGVNYTDMRLTNHSSGHLHKC